MKCGRSVVDGAGFTQTCGRSAGHRGPHESYWRDRDGRKLVGVTWRYERDGAPVVPGTPNAVDVTKVAPR